MSNKPMPDWMMQYVSNIGTDECFSDFRQLSKDYYTAIDNKSGGMGRPVYNLEMLDINKSFEWKNPQSKTKAEKFKITEDYKQKASFLAQEHGCDRPTNKGAVNKKTDEMRHNNPQGQFISYEDPIAKKAISDYQNQYPDKAAKSQENADRYKDKELKEHDREQHHKHNAKSFDKTQDRFEATRLSEKERHDKRYNPSPDAEKKSMSGKFFISLGVDSEKLQSITDKYNKSTSPKKEEASKDKGDSKAKESTKPIDNTKARENDKADTDKSNTKNPDSPNMADNFFKGQGFKKSDISKTSDTGKTGVSFSYLGSKGGDKSPSKAPEISRDKD